MTNRAIEQSEKFTYQLVLLEWNEGSEFVAYTDWTSNVIAADLGTGNVDFQSRPTMEVRIPKNTGDLADEVCTVDLTLAEGFLTNISNGLAHATVTMTVAEISRPTSAAPQRTAHVTHRGTITLATRNVNGRANNVRLSSKSPKALTAGVPIGQPCNVQCVNNFGDGRCQVSVEPGVNSFFGALTAISGRTVTINISSSYNADPKYFHRGWVRFGGLRVMIRDWSSTTPNQFVLVRQPPASWLGQSVLVYAGCDKSVETCRARYNNEEHFNGVGFAMPGYLPIFESS